MEVNIEGGIALKQFVRALTCLTRFGEDLDFNVQSNHCSISTVNSSRTAFGVVNLFPTFFQSYHLSDTNEGGRFKFSVNGKSLLSPLRPKSANTIESCTIQIGGSDDPNLARLEPGVDAGECRIVIRLNCQHGIVKTHRLTYSNPNTNNWARFDKSNCTSTWKASSRVLREWMDHFYLRSGAHALTDEITFYCSSLTCRLKSFVDNSFEQTMSENDIMTSRPLTTELSVDVGDFDIWEIPDFTTPIITFALKEFKAIINLSEALSLPITAHFTEGGKPLQIEVEGDYLESHFVVATTNYDSSRGGGGSEASGSGSVKVSATMNGGVKREKSESVQGRRSESIADGGAGGGRSATNGRLFNDPTPSPAPQQGGRQDQRKGEPEEGDEDFDWGGFDDADAAFAEIDHLSQVASSQQQPQQRQERRSPPPPRHQSRTDGSAPLGYGIGGGKILVRDTSEIVPSRGTEQGSNEGSRSRFEEDEDFGKSPEPLPRGTDETVLGPTQGYPEDGHRPRKKSKWNILDDE
ncbi:hypothetical protein JCM16303_004268 [Sporobolomyces ruberrimus]